MNVKRTALAILAALLAAACSTPAERGVAAECGPRMSAAQSCTDWYSGGS